MAKITGLDIGTGRIKIACVSGGRLLQYVCANTPDKMVRGRHIADFRAMGEHLRGVIAANHLRRGAAAISVPYEEVSVRTVTLPLMNVKQLQLNLPYEFREYVDGDLGDYRVDYSVLNRTDAEMTLFAVAMSKDLIDSYAAMCRQAGLKLTVLAPDITALSSLIREYEKTEGAPHGSRDYAFLDVGESSTRIHFFKKGEYDVTRTLDTGMRSFAEKSAELLAADLHDARLALEQNRDGVQNRPGMQEEYHRLALQIMRAVTFYCFSNRDNSLERVYCMGGGTYLEPLIGEIEAQIRDAQKGLDLRKMEELLPAPLQPGDSGALGPQAIGITLQ